MQRCGGRECEVFLWLICGKSDRVIGGLLGISACTVSSLVACMFAKLAVNNRTLAAAEAAYILTLRHLGLLAAEEDDAEE